MLFKFFILSDHTEKNILKAGFSIQKFKIDNIYIGAAINDTVQSPQYYLYKGEVWTIIDSSDIYERTCLLAKTPFPSFDKLWHILLDGSCKDDRNGSLILMNKKFYGQLRVKYKELLKNVSHLTATEKRALKLLSPLIKL